MPTIAIVSQKGGSGKTSTTVHLATAAARAGIVACIIDCDPQASAAAWSDWRQGDEPEVITAPPARLAKTIDEARKLGAELIVIDTPPHADAAAREAVKAADLVLIPCRPRAFDMHAVGLTGDLVRFAGKPAFVVFNAGPARGAQLIAEAKGIVEQLGLQVAPVTIADRAAFAHATAAGKTAMETEPDSRAAAEIDALWRWAAEQVGLTPHKRSSARTRKKNG